MQVSGKIFLLSGEYFPSKTLFHRKVKTPLRYAVKAMQVSVKIFLRAGEYFPSEP